MKVRGGRGKRGEGDRCQIARGCRALSEARERRRVQCFSFEQAWNTGRLGLTKREMVFAIKRMRLEFVAEWGAKQDARILSGM